jgi:hypothetical protein
MSAEQHQAPIPDWGISSNYEVACPHCGMLHRDLWDHRMEDEQIVEVECDCGKTFLLKCSISVEYSAAMKP